MQHQDTLNLVACCYGAKSDTTPAPAAIAGSHSGCWVNDFDCGESDCPMGERNESPRIIERCGTAVQSAVAHPCGCGRVYSTGAFLALPHAFGGGLTYDFDDDRPVVQHWRNCSCRSTLMVEVAL